MSSIGNNHQSGKSKVELFGHIGAKSVPLFFLLKIPGVTFEESTIESKDQIKKICILPENIYKV